MYRPPNVLALIRPARLVIAEAGSDLDRHLTSEELDRSTRFRRAEDREDFVAAHCLIRVCVARLLGRRPADVTIVQRCTRCGGPHGRPDVAGHPDVGASLAHSRGVVAAAAGVAPVGIDIEVYPPVGGLEPEDLSAALTAAELTAADSLGDQERALLLAWARKEACLKAGLVDVDGLSALDLSPLPLDPPPGDLTPRSVSFGRWTVHDWWDGRTHSIGALVAPAGVELTLAGA